MKNEVEKEGFPSGSNRPTPLALSVTLAGLVFSAEALIMLLLAYMPPLSGAAAMLIDSLLLVTVTVPFMYFLVYRPMARQIGELKNKDNELGEMTHSIEEIKARFVEHELILKASSDCIIRMDGEGIIHTANAVCASMFGFTNDEFKGKNLSAILSDDTPSTLLHGYKSFLNGWDEETNDASHAIEANAVGKDGHRIPVEISIFDCMIDAKIFYVAFIRDITERNKAEEELRENEARFRSIFENSNDAIFIVDPSGDKIIDANLKACDMLGYPHEELLLTPMSAIHPDEIERLQEFTSKVFEEGSGLTYGLTCMTKLGLRIPAGISASIMDIEGEKVMVAMVRDFSKRKQAEGELIAAKEEAEEATLLKDKFVSLVAHDLKSPFTSILGTMNLLSNDPKLQLSENQRRLMDSVLSNGDRVVTMIDEMLDISRLKTGKIMPNLKFLDGQVLCGAVLGSMDFKTREKGIKIVNEIPESTRLYADSTLFFEVITNLLTNAIKFCDEGDTITLFVPHGRPATIAVRDTGPGISDTMLPDLFKSEVKTTTKGSMGEPGTGLGLPYSFEIIKAHGGDITVESTQGEGSVFYVTLPDVTPQVMIVDDEQAVIQMVRLMLAELKVDIVEAESGEEAFEMVRDKAPHLILSDLNMPVMDGLALLKEIKGNDATKDIPVIIATASSRLDVREKVIRMGADDFIAKPFKQEELIPRIRKHIV